MSDSSYIPPPRPFWFVSSELAAELWGSEIGKINGLIDQHPQIPSLFDSPKATESERNLCFVLLAHRKVLEIIEARFVKGYEQPPSLGEEQSRAVSSTNGLVTSDAPDWTLGMERVLDALPYHLFNALPTPLHAGGFYTNDAAKTEAIQSAVKSLDTMETLQSLIEGVLNQQLERLAARWTAARHSGPSNELPVAQRTAKRKAIRTRDKQRIARDRLIAEIDDVSQSITEFVRLMDERGVAPQPTWSGWPGSWKEAYKDPSLRALIHKDKSRALSRIRHRK
jgi:hypothetical protein